MFDRFTGLARDIHTKASEYARQYNSSIVTPEHLLLAMLDKLGGGLWILQDLRVDHPELRKQLLASFTIQPGELSDQEIPLSEDLKRVIEHAIGISRSVMAKHVSTEHLLMGILMRADGFACRLLNRFCVTHEAVLFKVVRRALTDKKAQEGKSDPIGYMIDCSSLPPDKRSRFDAALREFLKLTDLPGIQSTVLDGPH